MMAAAATYQIDIFKIIIFLQEHFYRRGNIAEVFIPVENSHTSFILSFR